VVVNGVASSAVSAHLSPSWLARVEALWINSSPFQPIALRGLYHVVNGNVSESFLAWQNLRDRSGAEYDGSMYHFIYKRIVCTSDLALFRILTAALLRQSPANFTDAARQDLIDHCVALKMVLLSSVVHSSWIGPSPHQKMGSKAGMWAGRRGKKSEGWASGWIEGGDDVSIRGGLKCVSTSSTFLATIALGACCFMAFEVSLGQWFIPGGRVENFARGLGSSWCHQSRQLSRARVSVLVSVCVCRLVSHNTRVGFPKQPGVSPLMMDDKGYVVRHHILSASHLKDHAPGLLVSGPFW
jgi:hypothetical protein